MKEVKLIDKLFKLTFLLISSNFIHCIKISLIFLIFLSLINCTENKILQYVKPEDAGYSTEKLDELKKFLDISGSSSMLLLHDGKILFEYGDIHRKHTIHSIRKALLNSLYGIYVGRGVIDTNLTMGDLEIDDTDPGLSDKEKEARISDLLKSRSGIYHSAAAESRSMADSRPDREAYSPGEYFYYNNWDFNTLGYIFEKISGKKIYTAFYEEIAEPIGMINYRGTYSVIDANGAYFKIPPNDGFYQYEKDKSLFPAYHFRMSAYDLALYGQLFLNGGKWEDKKIIPKSWIEASTKHYSITNEKIGIGYGMLWKVLIPNEQRSTISFFHTGAGIHMLGIYPDSKIVLVHRVDTENDYDFPQSNLYRIISFVFGAWKK